ncbi:MAG: sulfatase-like hydrolase/transferase [Phycisphaerae bacterium]|nr:sulfatase-like hydrolase/transferase [Phycisphaerae bacterium]
MNRRQFLKASGAGMAGLTASGLASASEAYADGTATSTTDRPNILFIMTDQQFAGAMSCAGNARLRTPAMDRLAKQGVRFEKAYCAQPLCVPSRTAMMTGRMPHETGVTVNMNRHAIGVPMLGEVFSNAGYDCGYAGKWHLTVPQTDRAKHGFETVMCQVSASPKSRKDRDIAPACKEFLGKSRKRPFLLVASFLNPHDICQWARGDNLPNGPVGQPPAPDKCPPLPENFEIPPNEPSFLREMQVKAPKIYPTTRWTPDRWRQYRWAYNRLVERVDTEIGKLLAALSQSGHADDTLIVFTSDHGDGGGAHRWNQKQVLYEEPARVPFILSGRGVVKPGREDQTHLISTGLDLMPTLCDYAGIDPPAGLRGMSVRPIAEGRAPKAWRDSVVSETTFSSSGESFALSGRMLRTTRYKYIVYSKGTPREQLFDMERDPGETRSLVGQPEHHAALNDCRRRLAAWCKATGDAFDVPGAS